MYPPKHYVLPDGTIKFEGEEPMSVATATMWLKARDLDWADLDDPDSTLVKDADGGWRRVPLKP